MSVPESLRLLLVEDDDAFGQALAEGLRQSGHQVDWLRDGSRVEAMLVANLYDAVLLDLTLPDTDGQELLRDMRRRQDPTSVIVISARGHRSDRIGLLEMGADDYLGKPVDLGELEARLHAVLRRARPNRAGAGSLMHGGLRMELPSGLVSLHGRRIALRERERLLLELFLRDRERVFTRAQLETAAYGEPASVDSNAVEVHVHHLRRKIAPDVIVTVRGLGYRLGPLESAR